MLFPHPTPIHLSYTEEKKRGEINMNKNQHAHTIKGLDNPTCQLLPISSKRKVKTGWDRQERERRWVDVAKCHACLPHRMEVDASKCHACHTNSRGVHGDNGPEPAQCHKCHACHTQSEGGSCVWGSCVWESCVWVSRVWKSCVCE